MVGRLLSIDDGFGVVTAGMVEAMNDIEILIASILWRPVLPVAVIGLLIFVATAASLFAYWRLPRMSWSRRLLLGGLRLLAITLLAFVMLGPSQTLESKSVNTKGRLYIMADVSESMLTKDQDGESRLEQMQKRWLSGDSLVQMNESFTVEPYQFAEQSLPIAGFSKPLAAETGKETFLVQSTAQLISRIEDNSNDALLLLSDGIDSEDASIGRVSVAAKAKGLEIHTVAFGGKSSDPDTALMATSMQEFLYPNESGSILARVYQVGCRGQKTLLTIKQGDSEQTLPIDFSKRDFAEIKIPVSHKEAGQYEYECSLAAVPGEKETGNNQQTVFVTVQPRRMKVLLIEGSPNWDSKFIAQSLRKDVRIELVQLSQITRSKKVTIITRSDDGESTFRVPETAKQWSQFDVVLFGRHVENVLSKESAEALVEQYNQAGISIVFARGRAADLESRNGRAIAETLAEIEPVTWGEGKITPSSMSLTPSGKVIEWFLPTKIGLDVDSALSRLNGFQVADVIDEVNPIARVIAESPLSEQADESVPSIVMRTNQTGSVVTFTGDGLWKWSLLSLENQDLVGFYDSFWSNLIRWLVAGSEFRPGEEASMRLSRANVKVGEKVTIDVVLKRQLASGADPVLEFKCPDGSTKQVPLKALVGSSPRYQGTFAPEATGVYETNLSTPGLIPKSLSQKFHVFDATVERLNTAAKPVNMKMIAKQSNGRFYGPNDCEKFLNQLKADEEAAKVPPRAIYIWDSGWLMFLVVVVLGSEWIGRKMVGLI